jgi:adenine-specific DNA-methyltransferase
VSREAKKARPIEVAALKHDAATRRNIPTAEFESVMQEADKTPIQLAYERRNRDLDPQLVWRGKDEQDWSDLVVSAPPLYIQEKVHPKVIIDDLRRQSKERAKESPGLSAGAPTRCASITDSPPGRPASPRRGFGCRRQ